MKKLKRLSIILSLLLISTIFSGCCIGTCKPEIKYVDRPVEVKVPVKCSTPDVNCSFKGDTYTETIGLMIECIVELKRANEVCK